MNIPASQSIASSAIMSSSQAGVANQQQSTFNNQKTLVEPLQKSVLKESEETIVSLESLQKQVEGMNNLLEANFTSLKFNVHEKLSRVFVQVISQDTDEVVREIPSEKFLDMMASMLEFVGLLIDKKV
ncbi:MAG TPA: flagellar protein FlaG [Bacilli bacterium]|nr:flagellar protein FlaG [Bacilli bacterium]